MNSRLPTRQMRERPNLKQLKRQAKELLTAFARGDRAAREEISAYVDHTDANDFALHDAQSAIARSYGFESWPKLKAHVDGVTIRRLMEAVQAGDITQVRKMLRARPELADMAVSYGDERRAIHYAVLYRQAEIARLLMEYGANARAGVHPQRDATSAWILANERGYEEIVQIFEAEERKRRTKKAPPVDDDAEEAGNPARMAVERGDGEWLQRCFLEGGLRNQVRAEKRAHGYCCDAGRAAYFGR